MPIVVDDNDKKSRRAPWLVLGLVCVPLVLLGEFVWSFVSPVSLPIGSGELMFGRDNGPNADFPIALYTDLGDGMWMGGVPTPIGNYRVLWNPDASEEPE
jgi:hypothetical protein